MANISNELCEICGLKYCKEKVVLNNGQTPNVDIKPFYLDFEQPENFVILFELINKQTRSEFLQILVQRLRVEAGWYTDEIKQSIRETEWVYG